MSPNRKRLYKYFFGYFVIVMAFAVIPQSISFWNRVDPHMLGLPFAQMAVIVFAILLILGLASLFVLEGVLNDRERRERLAESEQNGH